MNYYAYRMPYINGSTVNGIYEKTDILNEYRLIVYTKDCPDNFKEYWPIGSIRVIPPQYLRKIDYFEILNEV